MNQFYVLPEQVTSSQIVLTDQEAQHASKVLRKEAGETIYVTDGAGTRYKCKIESTGRRELRASIVETRTFRKPGIDVELCLGLIRKRDRLEFAVEKATELGVSKISLFRADHTEPFKVRTDRIEAAVQSAMKQSLRVFLPEVKVYDSLDDLLDRNLNRTLILKADANGKQTGTIKFEKQGNLLMVVGPEGGLSTREAEVLNLKNARPVSLGDYRLRAETAAMLMAATFGHKKADPEGTA